MATAKSTAPQSSPPRPLALVGLAAAQNLRGIVHDDEGDPVAGALVVLETFERETRADAEGRFLFEGVPLGGCRVRCHAEGYLTLKRFYNSRLPDPLRILLSRSAGLSGRVVVADTDDALEGTLEDCRLEVRRVGPDGRPWRTTSPDWFGWDVPPVASDGSFATEGLPATRLWIRAVHPELGASEPTVLMLTAGETTNCEFLLHRGGPAVEAQSVSQFPRFTRTFPTPGNVMMGLVVGVLAGWTVGATLCVVAARLRSGMRQDHSVGQ